MIPRARSLLVLVLMTFAVTAWAAEVSAVQGEATYDKAPKFDVAKQAIAFDGTEYKWTDLIDLKLRPMQETPRSGYKIFLRNGNVIYADIVGAGLQGVTILLNVKSPLLGPDAVALSTDNIAGVQSLNPKVYQQVALNQLKQRARLALFRVIDFAGKSMNADDLDRLFATDPDQFVAEGEKMLVEKSAAFERSVQDQKKWEYDFIYGTSWASSQINGTIQGIKPNLDVILLTPKAGRTVSSNLNEIVGLSFKAVNQPVGFGANPYVKVIGVRGDSITGQIVSEKDGVLELKTDIGDTSMKVALSEVAEVVFYNGSFTFLSDLPDSAVTAVEYGEIALPGEKTSDGFSWQRDRSTMQKHPPLRLGGKIYRKGIGMHSYSELTFNIGGAYKRFKATVGIDEDAPKPGGNLTIEIQGDAGKVLLPKTVVKTGDKPLAVDVDVTGVTNLKIIVDFGEDGYHNDHCDLANAILVK